MVDSQAAPTSLDSWPRQGTLLMVTNMGTFLMVANVLPVSLVLPETTVCR